MVEWHRSGPEPGKDYSGTWYDTAVAFRPTTLFDRSIGVIIFTGEVAQEGRSDFGRFPRRP